MRQKKPEMRDRYQILPSQNCRKKHVRPRYFKKRDHNFISQFIFVEQSLQNICPQFGKYC